MYPLYLHFALMLELEKELERREFQERSKHRGLFWTIGQSRLRNRLGRKMARRFGTLMVLWGSKLQNINTVSPTDIVADTKLSQ